MSDTETITFLLRTLEENWLHARLSEDKRATLAHLVVILAVILQTIITLVGLSYRMLPLALLLPLLGIYALFITIKLYERAQFHTRRARKLRARLDELLPDARVEHLQRMAEEEHADHYKLWMHTRLNTIWLFLYAGIIVLGCIDVVLCTF